MKSTVLVGALLGVSLFVGCGDSARSNTSDIGKGTYIDSEVDGVKYECGSQIGVTGDTGEKGGFKYEKGESCTFSINGIELSEVLGSDLNKDAVKVKVGDTNVAIFLQSLDMDGNATNGITISPKVVEVLADNGKAILPKTPAEVQSIVNLLSSKGIGYNGSAIAKNDAQMHLAGFSVTMSVIPPPYFEGEEIRFVADVAGNKEGLTYEWVGLGETSPSLTTSDLPAGKQTIVVNVTKGDITFNASQTIDITATGGFAVNITGGNSNYTTDDDVMLEATVSGNIGDAPTYVWKDGDMDLTESTKTLTQKFDAGSHSVTVDVTENGVTESASFSFNVSDLTDFNISGSTIGQISTGLMWVNELDASKEACLVVFGDEYNVTVKDANLENAKTFCNQLDFASFKNWRTPTTAELSDYIKKTNEVNIETNYAGGKTCPQLLSINADTDVMDSINYRAVTTRFMDTQYFSIGTVRTHTYGADVDLASKYNVGLRCVRNIDGTGGEDIPGSNISVSITGAKANYIVGEDVNLTVNVTGATTINGYSWIEDDVEIGTMATLSKNDFGTGAHTVTVKVTADDINKSKSVTFNVVNAPDLSDFNITSLTVNNDEVIIQKSTGLMWVNESDVTKGKCAKIHANTDTNPTMFATEFESAKTFCSSDEFGNFAGLNGWRTPTSSEMKQFIESTIAADILPAYDAPCAKLLALTGSAANIDNNDSYVTVTTRHSTTTAGVISASGDLVPNIGLRCVRTHQ